MKRIDFDFNLEKIIDDASYEMDLKWIVFFYLLLIPIILFLSNFIFNLECIILLIIGTVSYSSMIYLDSKNKRNKKIKAQKKLQVLLECLSKDYIVTDMKQLADSLILKEKNIYPKQGLIIKENNIYFLDIENKLQILRQIKTQLLNFKMKQQELYLLNSEEVKNENEEVEIIDKKLVFKTKN